MSIISKKIIPTERDVALKFDELRVRSWRSDLTIEWQRLIGLILVLSYITVYHRSLCLKSVTWCSCETITSSIVICNINMAWRLTRQVL